MNEKITLEKFMEMNPELVKGLRAAENEFREAQSKRVMTKNDHKAWTEYQELRDIAASMDDIVKRAEATREILRQQNNENHTQSKHE